jgi:hypothetical protein
MHKEYGDDDRYMVQGQPLMSAALNKFPDAGYILVKRGGIELGGVARLSGGPVVVWDMAARPVARRRLLPKFMRIGGLIHHGRDEVTRYWRIGRTALVLHWTGWRPSVRVSRNFDYKDCI